MARKSSIEITAQNPLLTEINWDQKIRYPLWFRKRTYIKTVSQFYHGERLTQIMCHRLLTELSDPDAKIFVERQLSDEARHEEIFKTYVERMGEIAPIEPALEAALQGSLAWRGSEEGAALGLIICFHVVFERGAVNLLERLSRRFPCPLFRDISQQVKIDEGRHIAFGVNYVRDNISKISEEERLAIYSHVSELWRQCARSAMARYSLPVAMVTRLGGDWVERNWRHQDQLLRNIGLAPS